MRHRRRRVENGVVLDLRNMREVRVDRQAATATIGAGAQLIDVYAGLAAHGVTVPAGSCPSVGIGGHALWGGMGLAGRAFGLATDNIQAVELVSADGTIRHVDGRSDPDLLWGLRGAGGGNFGVVTSFRLAVHPLPASAAWFFVSWPWSDASDAIAAWQSWAPHARDELTSILHLDAGGGTSAVSVSDHIPPVPATDRISESPRVSPSRSWPFTQPLPVCVSRFPF
jgi:FAD/FMN-containing dehydrogenase